MLAEFVENATIFSPSNTEVRITGNLVAKGFAVDIEDRGLGMSDDEHRRHQRQPGEPAAVRPVRLGPLRPLRRRATRPAAWHPGHTPPFGLRRRDGHRADPARAGGRHQRPRAGRTSRPGTRIKRPPGCGGAPGCPGPAGAPGTSRPPGSGGPRPGWVPPPPARRISRLLARRPGPARPGRSTSRIPDSSPAGCLGPVSEPDSVQFGQPDLGQFSQPDLGQFSQPDLGQSGRPGFRAVRPAGSQAGQRAGFRAVRPARPRAIQRAGARAVRPAGSRAGQRAGFRASASRI